MPIRSVCVFCGSSPGHSAVYRTATEVLGCELVRRTWRLVYGGGSVGLMGVLADAVLDAGGDVLGVLPAMLATRELTHAGVSDMRITPDMHSRKALMAENADAFVALPGGLGTFEELFEMITWAQLGTHAKPIGLLNVSGFYDPLVALVEHAISEGFVRPGHRELFVVESEPTLLLDRLTTHHMPAVRKWVTPPQV